MTNRAVTPRVSAARTANAGPGDARALQRRRIAVAVQLAFAVGAGATFTAPVHAQQIICPVAGVTVIAPGRTAAADVAHGV